MCRSGDMSAYYTPLPRELHSRNTLFYGPLLIGVPLWGAFKEGDTLGDQLKISRHGTDLLHSNRLWKVRGGGWDSLPDLSLGHGHVCTSRAEASGAVLGQWTFPDYPHKQPLRTSLIRCMKWDKLGLIRWRSGSQSCLKCRFPGRFEDEGLVKCCLKILTRCRGN